jgi:hypothetical protein
MLAGREPSPDDVHFTPYDARKGDGRRRARRISTIFVLPLVALSIVLGVATALTITASSTEYGTGAYESGTSLTYWTLDGTFADTMHAPLPGRASGAAGFPTVLPAAAQSYRINGATSGDLAVRWNFTESTAAHVNTEIEITFTITYGVTGATSTITVYVETQGTAPTNPVVFQFYFDAGTATPGSVAIQAFTQVSEQCSAVGTCP